MKLAIRAALCAAILALRRGACAKLAQSSGQADRADRTGRRHRRDGAADGGKRHARPRPAGGGREPSRRLGAFAHQTQRALRPTATRSCSPTRRGSPPTRSPSSRSPTIRRATSRRSRWWSISARRSCRSMPTLPVKTVRRTDRPCQGQSRQAVLRGRRHRGARRFAARLFNKRADLGMVEVPYRSAAQMAHDVAERHRAGADQLDGRVATRWCRPARSAALRISSTNRFPPLPDLPAINETVPGVNVDGWFVRRGADRHAPRGRAAHEPRDRRVPQGRRDSSNACGLRPRDQRRRHPADRPARSSPASRRNGGRSRSSSRSSRNRHCSEFLPVVVGLERGRERRLHASRPARDGRRWSPAPARAAWLPAAWPRARF